MEGTDPSAEDSHARSTWFGTTHWSVVLAAGKEDSEASREALETLCRTYWAPLYAYVRRRNYHPEDAQDLTQEFFTRFLARNDLRTVQPGRGKFRSYLLAALQHFLANEWDKVHAAKRGGGQFHLPLDELSAEDLYGKMSGPEQTPEEVFDRSWALALLEQVRRRLHDEYTAKVKEGRLSHFMEFLPGEASPLSYAEAARQLGLTEEAVRSEVYRLRKRYRELVRLEIARTVASPGEIEEELRYLITVLSRTS
jgi:RNA polymerase sigma factor (sigma-70 family)